MSEVDAEIARQPECWRAAARLAVEAADRLPVRGERVAALGCGSSWFAAQAYAGLREAAGHGETDAFIPTELPPNRRYDRVVAFSRSGTTTEVVRALETLDAPSVALVGDAGTPATRIADASVELPFAADRSVVMTSFATSTLALLRAGLGDDLSEPIAQAETAVRAPLPLAPEGLEQISYLGRGWSVGLAHEAALKAREAAGFWAESYPAMDYRHGPIAVAGPRRAVWMLGEPPEGLAAQVEATGGRFLASERDPLAELVLAQRLAVELARLRGADPDSPRNLTRSVIL